MDDLIIRTDNGDFDLFGNEDIVQTFSIFNLSDISSRSSDYSNEFNLPLTNHNRLIIGYSDYVNSINTSPYKKLSIQIIVGGIVLKNGFMEIINIQDVISARFYTGNGNFYSLAKSKNLNDLDWSTFDHFWNYTNAVAASANTSGYCYPVMSYNQQALGGNTVDIRLILPATYVSTILDFMYTQLGYTYVNDFDTSDLDLAIVPYASKNPEVSASVRLLNSVDLSNQYNYFPIVATRHYNNTPLINFATTAQTTIPINYDTINTVGSSTYYNFFTRKFTAQYSGTYSYSFFCELVDYDYMQFNFSPSIASFNVITETRLVLIKTTGTTNNVIKNELSASGALTASSGMTTYPTIPAITQTTFSFSLSDSIYLNSGESLTFELRYYYYVQYGSTSPSSDTSITVNLTPQVITSNYLTIDLSPELVFGGLITYSSMLPKIKCSDFIKDILVRFGLIINVDEGNKSITLRRFSDILDNFINPFIWTDKLDETEFTDIKYKYDTYSINNFFKHREDKSITITPTGSNYNLIIDNQNLESQKDLYTSPFGVSQNISYNGYLTTGINLIDSGTQRFERDISYRICFARTETGKFKFTDGASTSGFLNNILIWFIDQSKPELSMGFELGLIPKNSQALINVLQNLRILKVKVNLNIIDIMNLDFFRPVYLEQYQAYFFISSINQFNYTNPQSTEVELIKLNF